MTRRQAGASKAAEIPGVFFITVAFNGKPVRAANRPAAFLPESSSSRSFPLSYLKINFFFKKAFFILTRYAG